MEDREDRRMSNIQKTLNVNNYRAVEGNLTWSKDTMISFLRSIISLSALFFLFLSNSQLS